MKFITTIALLVTLASPASAAELVRGIGSRVIGVTGLTAEHVTGAWDVEFISYATFYEVYPEEGPRFMASEETAQESRTLSHTLALFLHQQGVNKLDIYCTPFGEGEFQQDFCQIIAPYTAVYDNPYQGPPHDKAVDAISIEVSMTGRVYAWSWEHPYLNERWGDIVYARYTPNFDFNNDGGNGLDDVHLMLGSTASSDERMDINGDGGVGLDDVSIVLGWYFKQ